MTEATASQSQAAPGAAGPDGNGSPRTTLLYKTGQFITQTPSLWTYAVLIILVLGFSVASHGQFGSVYNLRNILLDGSLLMVVSVGMTMVIISGGIDLSIGAVTIFGGVIAGLIMETIGGDSIITMLIGLVAAIVVGIGWGAVNGFLVSYARVAPLIATLGTLGMATGLALVITGGNDIRAVPMPLVTGLGNGTVLGIPWLVVVAIGVAILGALYLNGTRTGLYLFAIGSNRDAASRTGVRVRANVLSVYVIIGALAGLAGFLALARFQTTSLVGHTTDNLQAIAAVVLGGTSLFGGRGGISGTVAGVLIPAVLSNGFVILGVAPFWQQFAIGLVLVIAVYTDQLRRRRIERE